MTEGPAIEIQWSPETHSRFAYDARGLVCLLLLVQKRTKFVSRDVFINKLLPTIIGTFTIPILYFSNIDFDTDEAAFTRDLEERVGKVHHLRIARRLDGRSKGFGFLQMHNVQANNFLRFTIGKGYGSQQQYLFNGREIAFAEAK